MTNYDLNPPYLCQDIDQPFLIIRNMCKENLAFADQLHLTLGLRQPRRTHRKQLQS